MNQRPSIDELEAILNQPEGTYDVRILPNGEVHAVRAGFEGELRALLDRYDGLGASSAAMATYLLDCLHAFERATKDARFPLTPAPTLGPTS